MKNLLIMKKFAVFILLLTIGLTVQAQNQTMRDYYKTQKKEEGVFNLSVPGWLMRVGVSLSGTRKDLNKQERRLLRKIRRVRLLSAEKLELSAVQLRGVASEDRYEELILLRDQGENIELFIQEDEKAVRKLLILVQEEDSLTIIDLKMKVKHEFLQELLLDSADQFLASIQY